MRSYSLDQKELTPDRMEFLNHVLSQMCVNKPNSFDVPLALLILHSSLPRILKHVTTNFQP